MPELTASFALQGNDGQSWSLQTEQLGLHAVDNIRKLRLQVRPRAEVDKSRLEKLLGTVLPDKSAREGAHQSPQDKVNNEATAYWLGPNDWLLLDPVQETDRIAGALREAAGGATSVLTDVSDAWSIIEITGEGAVSRLAQGCSVDLHDRVFPAGRYALTRLQHLSVIIHRLDDTPRFRILVDRSVAQYLRDWLVA
ncbi:MAG: hypothetical protein OXE42_13210 [Gammaproteobacteria bacterium]|nr:hypothetical protein [Gammaproteobacteria bacterium]